jgi:hypothetical protein
MAAARYEDDTVASLADCLARHAEKHKNQKIIPVIMEHAVNNTTNVRDQFTGGGPIVNGTVRSLTINN